MSRIDKAIETGSRLAVTYGCGVRGRNEERPLMRWDFFLGDENVLKGVVVVFA